MGDTKPAPKLASSKSEHKLADMPTTLLAMTRSVSRTRVATNLMQEYMDNRMPEITPVKMRRQEPAAASPSGKAKPFRLSSRNKEGLKRLMIPLDRGYHVKVLCADELQPLVDLAYWCVRVQRDAG